MAPARRVQKTRLSAVVLGLLLLCLALAFPASTQAEVSGPIDAGLANSVGPEVDAWAGLGNITLDDDSYVSSVIGLSAESQTLQATGYGFSIPENATINGITVFVGKYASNSAAIYDGKVMLIKGGFEVGVDKKDAATAWSGGELESTYGGEADLWESSWTPAEINDSSFGVAISAVNSDGAQTAYVDYIQVRVTFTIPAPTISNLTPANLPVSGGPITITGTDLDDATNLTVDGDPVSIGTNSSTQITATAPPHALGTVTVAVTTSGGSATHSLTYVALPTISGLNPNSGPLGGRSVTITGTNFVDLSGATAVTFGGQNATTYTVNSPTQITATAPAHAPGTVRVQVTAVGGSTADTLADNFTYVTGPSISGITPANLPVSGGPITITGTDLDDATNLTVDGDPVSIGTNSSTQITATAPPHALGTVTVAVTTSGGSATHSLTYVALPTISGLNPNSGPLGGRSVTITGTNFVDLSGATAVTFGGQNATTYTVNSPTQITATAPAHAPGTVRVQVTAVGGSTADTLADNFTYVTGPSISGITPANLPVSGGPITITGTDLDDATNLTVDGDPVSIGTNSSTQITATAPPHALGTVTVAVTTSGGSATHSLTYVALPTISGLNPNSGPLGGRSVTITGTNFVDLSGATAVTFGGQNATTYTVNSPTQITATAPAHAPGTVRVQVTAVGGSTADTLADNFTYVTGPSISGITPANLPVSGGPITITGTDLDDATNLTVDGDPVSIGTNSSTQITATAPPHALGTVTVAVTTSGGSATHSLTYVALPTISGLNPNSGPLGGRSVTITGTNFVDLSGATAVTFGGQNATTYTVNSPTQITATAPAHAPGTVRVQVTAVGGSTADTLADNFTYVTGPSISGITPANLPVSGGPITITGTDLDDATNLTVDGDPVSIGTNSSTQITATAPPHALGTVTVAVTTSGGSATHSLTYVALPTISGLNPNSGPLGGRSVTITGTNFVDLSGATAVTFGGQNATTYTVNSPTQITATAPAHAPGTVRVQVTAVGGSTADTLADNFTYVTGPSISGITPANLPVSGGPITITGTDLDDATNLTVDGDPVSIGTNSSTQITATAPPHALGTVTVAVTTSGGSATHSLTYVALPTISGLNPNSGPLGGRSVTITGTNFVDLSGATAVTFGGQNATTYTVNSPTQITATAPAHAPGTVRVQVTAVGGSTADTLADNFTYVTGPSISGITPANLPVSGGPITITGTDLDDATNLTVDGDPVSIGTNSSTQITATAPPHALGTVTVAVTTSGGSATHSLTYVALPTISGLNPNSGPLGGRSVTITGTNFVDLSGATAVTFGGQNATTYTVNSPTQITATAPAHAPGTVRVQVTAVGGSTADTLADNFTYVAPPTITSLSPTNGPLTGTTVTITGTGFVDLSGPAAVTFGGVNAASYTVDSSTQITAVAPSRASAGTVRVQVTAVGGSTSDTAADNFTYVAVPTIISLDPTSGLTAGGNTVTITGTDLNTALAVTFGGTSATFFVNSPTRITATAPAHTAGTVQVLVTTVGGQTANTGADDYTFEADSPTRYYHIDSHFIFSGEWLSASGGYAGYRRAKDSGSSVTIYFNGTQLDWIATKDNASGKADVYLDDVFKATVNLANASTVPDVNVWSTGTVAGGPHKVMIVWNTTNIAGKYISIAAVDVVGSLVSAPPPSPASVPPRAPRSAAPRSS